MPKINKLLVGKAARAQLVLGLAVLLLGILVYLVDRPPEQTLVPSAFSLCQVTPCVFGRLGQSLPTFAHVFAFSLLTAVLLGGGKRTAIAICLGWMAIEAVFELGQHPALAPALVKVIPSWFDQIPVLQKTDSYFLHGTFDHGDMLSIVLGALAAYAVIQKTRRRKVRHVTRSLAVISLFTVGVVSIIASNGGGGDGSTPSSTSPPITAVTLSLTQFATGLNSPVGVYNAGPGDDRLFVIEQAGVIRIVQSNGAVLPTPFVDISARVLSGGERGLLGLVFHPNYATNGFFYVNYTSTGTGRTHISRFSVTGNPNVADPNSEVILLTVDQPFSNHNAGDIHFGPDGFLYIPLGDGGSAGAGDPFNNAQTMNVLLGKIVRIDVDSGPGVSSDCDGVGSGQYTIPATNPFIDGPGGACDEIWALGLRNPWRSSFDRVTGDFYIGDVGHDGWEEIDFQSAGSGGGENYGWRCFEGNNPFNPSGCGPSSLFTFPIFAYPHTGGECSVIGGYVYRGSLFPALFGRYVLTDFCTGNFWDIIPDGVGGWQVTQHTNLAQFGYVSFGEDVNGELYVVHQGSGTLFRLEGM